MRVADYIFKTLKGYGVDCVFIVVGGASMHLTDALLKSGIRYVCCHHEQACAMAAEGYSRATGKLGVVCVSSAPAGTNCLTGVIGQWTDSVPVLYLSGQVKTSVLRRDKLRQLGDQEINIIDIVKPVTKYSKLVIKDIKLEIDRAIKTATTGRKSPVWLDIPLDIQSSRY